MDRKRRKRILKYVSIAVGIYAIPGILLSFLSPASTNHNMWINAFKEDFAGPSIHGFVTEDSPNGKQLKGVIVRYSLDQGSLVGNHDQEVFFWIPGEETDEYSVIHYQRGIVDEGKIYEDLSDSEKTSILEFRFPDDSKEKAKNYVKQGKCLPAAPFPEWSADQLDNDGARYVGVISSYGWHEEFISTNAYFKWPNDDLYFGPLTDDGRFVFPKGSKVVLLPWTQPRSRSERVSYFVHCVCSTPWLLVKDVAVWPFHLVFLILLYSGRVFI